MDWPFKRWFYQHFNSQIKAHALVLNSLSVPSFEVSSTPCSDANIFHSTLESLLAKGLLEKKGPLKFPSCCSDISLWALYGEIEFKDLAIINMCLINLFQHLRTLPPRLPFLLACQPLTVLGMAGSTRSSTSSTFSHTSAGNTGP